MKLHLVLLLVLVPASAVGSLLTERPASSQAADRAHASTPELRRATFDLVWQTIKDELFDPDIRGIDWEGARRRYAPGVETVRTDTELNELINRMLGELHIAHLGVVSYEDETKHTSALGTIGADIRMVEDQPVIVHVEKGSIADRTGLRPGFVVTGVDGQSVGTIAKGLPQGADRAALARDLFDRLQGDPGSPIAIAYLDADNSAHVKMMIREKKKGELTRVADNLPQFYVQFDTGRLHGGIGYIKFNAFVPVLGEKVQSAVAALRDAPAIILDLRGNTGGFDQVMTLISGSFVPKGTVVSTSKTRRGIKYFKASGENEPYTGPLVILIDTLTVSAAEELAAGLQEMGRAQLVGQTTQGRDLDTEIKVLPTGALLWYPTGDGRTPKGVPIEGRGVTPDIEVALTRQRLRSGIDLTLAAAIEYLEREKR
jgi:carboxyl-terminal processing protease